MFLLCLVLDTQEVGVTPASAVLIPSVKHWFWNSTTVSVSCLSCFDIRRSNCGLKLHTRYLLSAVFGTSDAEDC